MSGHQCPRDACSFLSLPPDIRVEVYRHLLGQEVFHFNDYFPELGNGGLFLCRASPPDCSIVGDSQDLRVVKLPQDELDKCLRARHLRCYSDWAGLDLQLLLVCRLIYQEACLVPFAENAFVFPSRDMVTRFLKRLTTWQAKAVTEVILHQQESWRYWQDLPSARLSSLICSPFRNLRRLTIFIELGLSSVGSDPNGMNRPDLYGTEHQDSIVAAMRDLMSERLEVVRVAIVVFNLGPMPYSPRIDVAGLEAWALRTRRAMMGRQHLS